MASSSSSSSGCWKYDVFLSFRGEDTRKTFVDHLYTALVERTISTYKDDIKLSLGSSIGPSLMKAIEASKILVIIFSENYADSSWCLDELSHIMKCRDSEKGQIVFPIFYHVDPSDVRKQKRKYGEAFAKHELSVNNKNKVESWKKALVDASNIAGLETTQVANGHEAVGIKNIVDTISHKLLSSNPSDVDEKLVGMETRFQYLKQQLKIGSSGVRMIGIWGIGGGGKTTLAFSVYMKLRVHFQGHCFVDNIREESHKNGLKKLQEKILSEILKTQVPVASVQEGGCQIGSILCRRNVLIVLDDVDDLEQLEALAGCHNWFGDGSRIIITTRNKQVLISHRVDAVCPVSLLSHDEAIRLFKRHAYHENNPVEDYEKLSLRVISYVNGLPLALKILGSFLYGKDKIEWMSTLDKLKHIPNSKVTDQLKISYDGLDHEEKELFLDIACFHRGAKEDKAMKMLDACGFHPCIGVKVLKQKALITVSSDGEFDMHDLVQEMAHYIVRGEHPNHPEKHSRVWEYQDIQDMCSRNATAENDKVIAIQCDNVCSSDVIMLVTNMKKIRLLEVATWFESNYDEGPSFLSNELRYLDWMGYTGSLFPESFQPRKLVVLKMRGSRQKELWKGNKYLPCLKELKLSFMVALVRTPDFGGLPCLQKLILKDCDSLEEIHQSLGNHKSIVSVKVRKCNKLTRFPSIVGMEKLEILNIINCNALAEFPRIEAKMDNLAELSLERVGIEVLPSSVGEYCTNLTSLELKNCSNLKSIEGNFRVLKGLKKFVLSGCSQLEKLPKDLFNENLDELRLESGGVTPLILSHFPRFLSGCSQLEKLPKDLFNENLDELRLESGGVTPLILSHFPRFLRKLNLNWCKLKDGDIPCEIGELSNLQELHLRSNKFTRLDFSLSGLARLKLLELSNCKNLVELPELPSSLAILKADDCESLEEVIRDEIHRNCKWLSQVSITGGTKKKNIIGGERLLKTMLQGNAVESGCTSLTLEGSEIPRGFIPRLVEGRRCRMQLPSNWFHDFSGFLICAVFYGDFQGTKITMKHVDKLEEEDSQHEDIYWEEETDYDTTWVGYVSFGLLRNTLWWDHTSTSIQMEIDMEINDDAYMACGFMLVQMETTTRSTHSSSEISLDDDHYKYKLDIEHDSKSAFRCKFPFPWE